jgi:hypothetical protein
MKTYSTNSIVTFFLVLCLSMVTLPVQSSNQADEVLVTFRYPAVGFVYVNILIEDSKYYLPVTEMFNYLMIPHYRPETAFSLAGAYLRSSNPYYINLQEQYIELGKETYTLSADEFRIGDLDYYLSPKVMKEVFGLEFNLNMNALHLQLITNHTLPVQQKMFREQARKNKEALNNGEMAGVYDTIHYPRRTHLINGGFLDYNLNLNLSRSIRSLGYSGSGGIELFGGDLQGTFTGITASNGMSRIQANNIRWKLADLKSDNFSYIMAGQMNSSGLYPHRIIGFLATNDPIEPRRQYQTFVFDGNTIPDSEVELFINNQLYDFRYADELGYYRFELPITYGTTRMHIRIYTPTGEVKIIERNLQVPFTFLPPGEVTYTIQGGLLDDPYFHQTRDRILGHASIAVGVYDWLTVKAGTESFFDGEDYFYTSFSARLKDQYLFNLELAPNAYYRLNGSVTYVNNTHLSFAVTQFDGLSPFNPRHANQEFTANFYFPFAFKDFTAGIRFGGDHYLLRNGREITNYSSDIFARVGRLNFRFGYRDMIFSDLRNPNYGAGNLSSALTYTFLRSPELPAFMRGMFVRLQTHYLVRESSLQLTELQFSRPIGRTGRFNLNTGYDFYNSTLLVQGSFTIDFPFIRSGSSYRLSGTHGVFQQNISGSVGYDHHNRHIVTSNRSQTGKAAAAVLLFIDNNANGIYDAGDEILPYEAVRLDRGANIDLGKDKIIRISQLQAYYKYKLHVHRNAIPDATLIPAIEEFVFVADPNQYKYFEIPFYRGGTIDGYVMAQRQQTLEGISGLRLNITGMTNNYQTTVRTFSDGGFYAMELPPGDYQITVDSTQLSFLGMTYRDDIPVFTIEALADGFFIEDFEIVLIPEHEKQKPPESEDQSGIFEDFLERAKAAEAENDPVSALLLYESVAEMMPGNLEVETSLAELRSRIKADSILTHQAYQQLIDEADGHFRNETYDLAYLAYANADELKPKHDYARDMMNFIFSMFEENEVLKVINEPVNIEAGVEKRFYFDPEDLQARQNNYLIIRLEFASETSTRIFINHGLNYNKHGGVVLRSRYGAKSSQYLVKLVPSTWFHLQNNWISIYSESNEVQIQYMGVASPE